MDKVEFEERVKAVARNATIGDLRASLVPDAREAGTLHRNQRIEQQIARIETAVANVIDKVEHGFTESEMVAKYANIAGCTANVLQFEVNDKRYGGGRQYG